MFLEIINPHRSGRYLDENIYVEEDFKKRSKEEQEEFDKKDMPKIYEEDDFKNEESRKSLEYYPETGFLIISYDAFLKWFGTIDICDPMFGSNEKTIVFIPDGSNQYSIDFQEI